MHDKLYNLITRLLGPHCGLNADWISCAWLLTPNVTANRTNGALYLVDDEDGNLSIYQQIIDDKTGECTAEHLKTLERGGLRTILTSLGVITKKNSNTPNYTFESHKQFLGRLKRQYTFPA